MMHSSDISWGNLLFAVTTITPSIFTSAASTGSIDSCLSNPKWGSIPGEADIYSSYTGIQAPWPGNTTGAILNTTTGPPGTDDLLFQNLLAAEWIIFSFYQQGLERFNESAFTTGS